MIAHDQFLGPDFPDGTVFVKADEAHQYVGRRVRFQGSIAEHRLEFASLMLEGPYGHLVNVGMTILNTSHRRKGVATLLPRAALIAVLP